MKTDVFKDIKKTREQFKEVVDVLDEIIALEEKVDSADTLGIEEQESLEKEIEAKMGILVIKLLKIQK